MSSRMLPGLRPTLALALLTALSTAACRSEPYCLNCVDGGAPLPDAAGWDVPPIDVVRDGGFVDTQPDLVIPDGCTPDAMEICNGFDDNCDGRVDEGIDTQSDPRNCGGCGMTCNLPHAIPVCVAGRCAIAPNGCDTGFYDLDGDPANGCEYACMPVPGATDDRSCNNRDDDCDGRIDEDIDLCSDPQHCGSCSRGCNLPHVATHRCARTGGAGTCNESNTRCEVGTCTDGFYDIDGNPSNGCEYACTPSGPEICDGRDNDCNGSVDDGDPGGGAACGSAVGACRRGVNHCRMGRIVCEGAVEPVPETCNGIDDDCNGMVDDGTLAADMRVGARCGSGTGDCVQGTNQCIGGMIVCQGATGPTPEVCDGRDNDCNGMIDDGVTGGGSCGSSVGACRPGTLTCVGGTMRCMGGTGPTMETCNGIDDDCDGTVDNGFDLNRDVNNCGRCGNSCLGRPNAIMGCSSGACVILGCAPGFVDLNGNVADGCEYACTRTSSTEVCDGLDNDCDGMTDEGLTPPAGFCRSGGACGTPGPTPTCMGMAGWRCTYPATVDVDPMTGQPAAAERRCDGIDNNCNGAIDEAFTGLGTTCSYVTPGTTCTNTGTVRCRADQTGTECYTASPRMPSAELCNGVDDDCDGAIDETALTPGSDPRFVNQGWVRVQPTQTCGIIPGSGGPGYTGTQARCTGDANCDSSDTTRCRTGYWCDASDARVTPARNAVCRPYYWIMQYEASAPNATATSRGDVLFSTSPRTVNRACSLPGVLPWTSVTVTDAQDACARIGATLCTEGQWQAACEVRPVPSVSPTGCYWGFETACTTYAPSTCNGLDFDFDTSMSGNQDGLLVTGSSRIPTCDAYWTGYPGAGRIFDLSGNARELTALRTGLTDTYPVRGGSYSSPQQGLRCDNNWTVVDSTFFYPNVGFRCCYTGATPP